MKEEEVGKLLRISLSVAQALSRSMGGVWVTNLLPTLDTAGTRVCSPRGVSEIMHALRIRLAERPSFEAELRGEMTQLQRDVATFVVAGPAEVFVASQGVLHSSAVVLRALVAPQLRRAIRVEALALAESFAALASIREKTVAEAENILRLRSLAASGIASNALSDSLFDLESS